MPIRFVRSALAILALGALAFFAFRAAQLLYYGEAALLADRWQDLARAFWMGARFDLKALSVMLLLLLVTLPFAAARSAADPLP